MKKRKATKQKKYLFLYGRYYICKLFGIFPIFLNPTKVIIVEHEGKNLTKIKRYGEKKIYLDLRGNDL